MAFNGIFFIVLKLNGWLLWPNIKKNDFRNKAIQNIYLVG